MFVNENDWIANKLSLKYIPQGLIDNMAALVQIMAGHLTGAKPSLSDALLVCCTDAYMRELIHVSLGDVMVIYGLSSCTSREIARMWMSWDTVAD